MRPRFAARFEKIVAERFVPAASHLYVRSDSKVDLIASGSQSHQIWPNRVVEERTFEISSEFNRLVDLLVLDLWKQGRIREFLAMLPDYRKHCQGEGGMHDTIILFGALGWEAYSGHATEKCDYFASSGTGQTNVVFTVD